MQRFSGLKRSDTVQRMRDLDSRLLFVQGLSGDVLSEMEQVKTISSHQRSYEDAFAKFQQFKQFFEKKDFQKCKELLISLKVLEIIFRKKKINFDS